MKKKNLFASTLRLSYPVAKYAAALLISLNLHRLAGQVEALPGVTVPRWTLMLWTALLLALGSFADRKLEKNKRKDAETKKNEGMNELSFLALAVPGLLILDAAAIAHLYSCWFQGGSAQAQPLHTAIMAVGCVCWMYGCALPGIPFGSVWGLRTGKTLQSQEIWRDCHLRYAGIFKGIGAACLVLGSFL